MGNSIRKTGGRHGRYFICKSRAECGSQKKKDLQIKDVATLYSSNTAMVQKLEKEPFYTLPGDSKILTMFTVTKIYEAVHKVYPKIQIENLGETDFIVEYEPQKKEKKWLECLKTIVVAAIVLIGSAFTIMTFNEDVNVAGVFDRIYHMVTGKSKPAEPSLKCLMRSGCRSVSSYFTIILKSGILK